MFLISFALATRARLLILDEPTNGLDIPNKQVWQRLLAAEVQPDQLVIISTHQVYDVEDLIDSVLIMKEGKIILNASLQALESKLQYRYQAQLPLPNSALYFEQKSGGYGVLSQNEGATESPIDLALLFNAAINNAQVATIMEGKENV